MKDVLLDLKDLDEELALEAKSERSIRRAESSLESQQTLIADSELTKGQTSKAINTATAQTASSAEYIGSEITKHNSVSLFS